MAMQLDDLISKHGMYVLLANQKNTYIRSKTESDVAEKIKYKVDLKDWLIYVDGNTFRNFIRGFAIGSSGIAFCDDNGIVSKFTIEELKTINISCSGKSLIVAGKCITIGDTAHAISDKLILIKRDIHGLSNKHLPVKMARLSEELWYLGYEGEVLGPFSKDKLEDEIKSGKYVVETLQIWTSTFSEWKMVAEVESLSNLLRKEKSILERIEIPTLDINNCSKDDILKVLRIREDKIEAFLKKREAGILLYNEFDFQDAFDLKPHELERLKNIVVFKVGAIKKKGRLLDI